MNLLRQPFPDTKGQSVIFLVKETCDSFTDLHFEELPKKKALPGIQKGIDLFRNFLTKMEKAKKEKLFFVEDGTPEERCLLDFCIERSAGKKELEDLLTALDKIKQIITDGKNLSKKTLLHAENLMQKYFDIRESQILIKLKKHEDQKRKSAF
jgi:hypothetical protein